MIGWELVDERHYARVRFGERVALVPSRGYHKATKRVESAEEEYNVPLGYWERNPQTEEDKGALL